MAGKDFHLILSEYERVALEKLSRRLKVTRSEVIRLGLRNLAAQHNLKIKAKRSGQDQLELKL